MQDSKEHIYKQARLARDSRFDGVFFTAVKTTGIYCRSICPATPPLEKNVDYYNSAVAASRAGYRPCLRCRPDSAPQSNVWQGTETSFQRAISLIDAGALQDHTLAKLSSRLGISDRYLRSLFQQYLGTSPKKYALYQQCLFAKKLLHESNLAVHDIAFASGFNSVRRFNEAIKSELGLAPTDIRKSSTRTQLRPCQSLRLNLSFRPPFQWHGLLSFLQKRLINHLEWADDTSYSRTIDGQGCVGYFTVSAPPTCFAKNQLQFDLYLNNVNDLKSIVGKLRSMFDLDAPIAQIDKQLRQQIGGDFTYEEGLRVPGIWGAYEAGIRAILGQQVSVLAAQKLVTTFVDTLGGNIEFEGGVSKKMFPTPAATIGSGLEFFRMPQSRKDTIHRLADHFLNHPEPNNIDEWLSIKGIGPWTVNYVKLRSAKDPDIWLAGDAGIKNAIKAIGQKPNLEASRPWRSYLTMHTWNQLKHIGKTTE